MPRTRNTKAADIWMEEHVKGEKGHFYKAMEQKRLDIEALEKLQAERPLKPPVKFRLTWDR